MRRGVTWCDVVRCDVMRCDVMRDGLEDERVEIVGALKTRDDGGAGAAVCILGGRLFVLCWTLTCPFDLLIGMLRALRCAAR